MRTKSQLHIYWSSATLSKISWQWSAYSSKKLTMSRQLVCNRLMIDGLYFPLSFHILFLQLFSPVVYCCNGVCNVFIFLIPSLFNRVNCSLIQMGICASQSWPQLSYLWAIVSGFSHGLQIVCRLDRTCGRVLTVPETGRTIRFYIKLGFGVL